MQLSFGMYYITSVNPLFSTCLKTAAVDNLIG